MEENFLEIRGLRIFVKLIGEGNPLVFLHGGPGGEHRYFLPHLQSLSEHFQLIFYDQRGCGQSQTALNDDYTLIEEVETLEELRIRLGIDKLNLIGESWGSMLALLYASKYPKQVNKIFLTAAVGAKGNHLIEFGSELENKLSIKDKELLEDTSNRLKNGEADVQEIFNIINPYYVYSLDTLTRKTKTSSNPLVNRELGKEIINYYDLTNKLEEISEIPILIAQGEYDIISPLKLKETLLTYVPHAQMEIIKDCGHWSIVEQPEAMKKLIKEFFS
ncbi:alpha/beta fold hydrolase [Neobacillus sp. D3-1R]|uniref:alpha/beta fold hydrolase n=1 Tax=Neobacillus sp. D3-1R TaxID=3445778 RepID=UPI003F9EC6F4